MRQTEYRKDISTHNRKDCSVENDSVFRTVTQKY
nr:MAG TPA: hypothetical protein [Caudoviricetes sp.]